MTPIPILDLKPQHDKLQAEIQAAIARVIETGEFIMGPDVKLFEQEVAAYLGVKHAIGVNSGTDALVIGLRAAGIGPGDEVITTPFSFFATAESISNVGATPVFADVDPGSFNLDPRLAREKITPRTKAILPVHLYGNPAAMGQLMAIAQEFNLKLIEDCAQSFGARYSGNGSTVNGLPPNQSSSTIEGQLTGTIGDVGAYSFFPSKNLGAFGDGGMIATNDDQMAEVARMLRVHGAKKKYHNQVLGYNSRLDTLQAAILRVKLPHIDEWNQARRTVAQTYNQLLQDIPGIITPVITEGHVFHQYTIRVLDGKRDELQRSLKEQGIGTMIYYPIPQDQLPIYKDQYPPSPISELLASQVLSLPIWPGMETGIIEQVVAGIQQALEALQQPEDILANR